LYADLHRRSLEDPEGFWSEQIELIDWRRRPQTILRRGELPASDRWFCDGRLNTCENALDRHVRAGRGAQPALIYDSPVTGTVRTFTYGELLDEVERFAGGLAALGVARGDRVIVYMPMVPEAVVGMLACARLGAIHSVVFGGFAPRELALRIDDARPKVVLAATCGIEPGRIVPYTELLEKALTSAAHTPEAVVLLQRPEGPGRVAGAWDWAKLAAEAKPADATTLAADDPLYILYTSGTTGGPKGVVRTNGGHAVALAWSMRNVYDVAPGEVFWAASDIGWVVGHSYIVYGPLLHGATTVLYEGKPVGTPDAGAFGRVVAEHRVRTLFCAPTALRAIRRADPSAQLLRSHDLSSLAHLFLAGERLDVDTLAWARSVVSADVVDHWWQTETGWPITAVPLGIEPLEVPPGSAGVPMCGFDVRVLDGAGREVPAGQEGAVVLRRPLPPGVFSTLWHDERRYAEAYFSAFATGDYVTGDGGRRDAEGFVFVTGRVDDVINVAGHRLSTGAMEEVISARPEVAECAVVGAADELKGQAPVALVVPAGEHVDPSELSGQISLRLREQVGPIATPRAVHVVAALPKTRSGKVLRRTLRQIVDGEPYEVPSTIEDADALQAVEAALQR